MVMAQACHATSKCLAVYAAHPQMIEYLKDIDNMTKVTLEVDSAQKLANLSLKLEGVEHVKWVEDSELTAIATVPILRSKGRLAFKKCSLYK
jgi:peptidyl-tRNA hydrolase